MTRENRRALCPRGIGRLRAAALLVVAAAGAMAVVADRHASAASPGAMAVAVYRHASAGAPDATAGGRDAAGLAKQVLDLSGLRSGLCVHLGCGRESSAGLTAELAASSTMLVHGLAMDDASLDRARKAIQAKGVPGRAAVEKVAVSPLPYLDNLANLVVIEDFGSLAAKGLGMEEVQRVVAPGGAICVLKDGRWTKSVKPRPKEMDEWTHPTHGAGNNWVSADEVARFPVGLRWQDGVPMNFNLWASCRAWVTANGRVFTLSTTEYENLASASFLQHQQEEYVTARDAFNGLPLWKVNCQTLNDGKALNHRNTAPLVTDGKRVFAFKKDRLVAFDAATGQVVMTYAVKFPSVRLLVSGNVIVSAGWEDREAKGLWDPWVIKTDAGAVEAFDVDSGKLKWSLPSPAQHVLSADGLVYLLLQSPAPVKEQQVVAVDLQAGTQRWRVPHTKLSQEPDLQLGVAGLGVLSVAAPKAKTVSILSAADGYVLWQIKPAGSFWTPLVSGLLWNSNKKYDPKTGQVKGMLPAGVNSGGCTPNTIVGNGNYVTGSRGCGYTDLSPDANSRALRYAGARGGCLQGAAPANGMFYTSQNFCRCAPGQVQGFVAFGPSGPLPAAADFEKPRPVEKGPAFGAVKEAAAGAADWPMFLHDARRSGFAPTKLPQELKVLWDSPVARIAEGPLADAWKARLTSCIAAPVAADGMVFLAALDAGQVVAIDAKSGKEAWRVTVGGRIDTPPTVHRGLCLFGCHDGWVYALRAADGQLAWRTRAAPWERRMVAFGQVESVWPALGSVLIHEDVLYATAGRTTESDGGLAVVALDPLSGRQLWGKAIGPGPVRVNDLLALRDGKCVLHHIGIDPNTGTTSDISTKDKRARDVGLEGLIDGTWTRMGTRRSGGQAFGMTVAEMLVWNDSRLFGYESRSKTCFVLSSQVARTTSRPTTQDYAWRLPMGANHQAEAMALCDSALVLAGRACEPSSQSVSGFLWAVSPADGKTIVELPLAAPPVYHGLAVANGRLYVSLQNGNVVCLGKAD